MNGNRAIASIILEGASTVEDVILTKDKKSNRVIGEGTLQDMDKENRNGRIYAEADLKPEINGARMKELIKHGYMLGEAGHPLSDDLIRQQTIDPKLTAVRYLKVWTEGKLVRGQFMGTNNNYGETFDQDMRDGYNPSFSLRALGSIENVGGKAYVKGIKIITWDWVVYPSHVTAYQDKLISESAVRNKEQINENQIIVPENDPGTIISITGHDVNTALDKLQKESANVTTIINTFDGIYDRIDLVNEHTLKMTSKFGETITVNLENHVGNVIRDYCFKF